MNTHSQNVSPVNARPFSALSVFTHLPSDILSQHSLLCTLWPFLLHFNTNMHLFPSNTVRSFKFDLCETFFICLELFLSSCVTMPGPIPHCSTIVYHFSVCVCIYVRVSLNSSSIWGWEMWVKWWSGEVLGSGACPVPLGCSRGLQRPPLHLRLSFKTSQLLSCHL